MAILVLGVHFKPMFGVCRERRSGNSSSKMSLAVKILPVVHMSHVEYFYLIKFFIMGHVSDSVSESS
jgi:hypothetical protein